MEIEFDVVTMIIGNDVEGGKFDIVMDLHLDDVREKVSTLQRQVLNDKVEWVICVLYAWDWDVSDLRK